MARKKAVQSNEVTVAGRTYTIQRSSQEHIGSNWGICDSANQTIHILDTLEETTSLPPEVIELHEILHATLFETGLCALMPDKIEEAVVHGLALQLYRTGYRRATP